MLKLILLTYGAFRTRMKIAASSIKFCISGGPLTHTSHLQKININEIFIIGKKVFKEDVKDKRKKKLEERNMQIRNHSFLQGKEVLLCARI